MRTRFTAAFISAAWLLIASVVPAAAGTYDWTDLEDELDARTGGLFQPDGGGLVIIHDGTVVYEEPFGSWTTMDTAAAHQVYSVSKWVAATVVMAVDDDPSVTLDLDDSADQYLPWIGNWDSRLVDVTVRQLLSHTAGFSQQNPLNQPCLADYTVTLTSCVTDIATDGLVADPGDDFRYTGAGFQVLGLIVEEATGDTWYDAVDDYLLTPCGLGSLSWDGTQNPWVAGGVRMNLSDGEEFVEISKTGYCGAHQVLSAASLAEMRQDQLGGATIASSPYGDGRHYGLGIFRNDGSGSTNIDLYSHAGAGGAHPWIDLGRGYSAFMLIDEEPAGVPTGFNRGRILFNAIRPFIEAQIDAN